VARHRPRGFLRYRVGLLNALDGQSFTDGLYCGAGTDSSTTDTPDRKTADCE